MSKDKVQSTDDSQKKVRMPRDAVKKMVGQSNWAALIAEDRRERVKSK